MKKLLIALNIVIWSVVAVEAKAEYCEYTSEVMADFTKQGIPGIIKRMATFEDRFAECDKNAECIDSKIAQWKEYGPEYDKLRKTKKYGSADFTAEEKSQFYRTMEVYSSNNTPYADLVKKLNDSNQEVAKYTAEKSAYDACEAKNNAAWKKQEAAWKAEAARLAALPGVRIGMSADAVLAKSSWGKPASVNRTTTAYGTREQWVYKGHNYLYFTNGVLTAIQN